METIELIKNVIDDFENNDFKEIFNTPNKIKKMKLYEIKYSKTIIIVNDISQNPRFTLMFHLINPKNSKAEYTYEIEYNEAGEILDDCLLKY